MMSMKFPGRQLKESQILTKIEQVFEAATLDQIAKVTGFVRRKSKLNAMAFLQMCMLSAGEACTKSLSQACTLLREIVGVRLRKQSLDERFTTQAVAFVKQTVEGVLAKEFFEKSTDSTVFSRFARILIGDCTCFALPARFTATYKGPGGIYPGSAIKLYLEYDFLSGSASCLKEDGWARSDQTFNEAARVNKGELVLKDLGFYSVPFFRELHQKGAYFISRLRAGSSLFKEGKKIALSDLIKDSFAMMTLQEYTVSIGSNTRERAALGQVRLVLEKVPPAIYEQKIRRTKALCASKGRQPSNDQLLWSQYNVFITNIPEKMFSAQQVRNTYRLRWQIEILFKAWKSVFQIHHVKPVQLHRFQCMLWASLLLILLFMPLLYFFKQYYWRQKQRELSEWKLLVWLKNHLEAFCRALSNKATRLEGFARKLYNQILEDGLKEKRKKEAEPVRLIPFDILFTL